jgi:acyl-coenzyme A synthetase/AMP-(fatty) acid ligase
MSDLFTSLADAWMRAASADRRTARVIDAGTRAVEASEAGTAVHALTAAIDGCGVPLAGAVMQVTARRPDWALAVVGLISGGRAWLPAPPERASVELTLQRTGVRWALVEDAAGMEMLTATLAAGVIACTPVDGGRWQLVELGAQTGGAEGRGDGTALPHDAAYIIPTSGSTGDPKWVVGSRRSLEHFVNWELDLLALEPGMRFAQHTPVTFDPVLREVLVAFASRGCLCVPGEIQRALDPTTFVDWLDAADIGVLHATPTLLRAALPALTARPPLPRLRHLLLAGEELFSGDLQPLTEHYGPRLQIYNLYGPTETTLAKFCHRVTPGDIQPGRPDRRIPVGKPIRGAAAITVTASGSPCVPGEVGEVYIRTPYRSLGYLGTFRGEAPAPAFVPNPFSADPADVVFATRDLAYCREDGSFVVAGRTDRIMKVRGVRVDLAVVECALRGLDGVLDAAVRSWRAATNNTVVVAYVVGRSKLDPNAMRSALRARLGSPAVPATFLQLDELPKTATGKIDRQSLPAPDDAGICGGRSSAELTELERDVLQIFNSVICGTIVGPDDELLDVGGQSIEAAQIATRVSSLYGTELPLRAFLDHSSPRAVAAYILRTSPGGTPGAGTPARAHEGQDVAPPTPATPAPARPGTGLVPASYAQLRFRAMQRLAPDTPQLHYVWAQRLRGAVDLARLGQALRQVVARHPAIRTRFVEDGAEVYQVFDVDAPVDVTVADRPADGPAGTALGAALADVAAWAARPFAFGAEALLRARWVDLGPGDGLFALTGHVVVSDGWTKSVLLHDLASAYALLGHDADVRGDVLLPPEATVAEFARWERRDAPVRAERHADYWRERVGDFFARPRLPFDDPAQGRPGISSGESVAATLTAGRARALRGLARQWRLSTAALTSAAMLASLWWWSGEPEPAMQVPVPNRPSYRYEPVVGCFTDAVLLRERVVEDEPFAALAARVRTRLLQALDNAVPYEALMQALYPGVDRHDPALTPMMFAPQPQVSRGFALPGVAAEEHRVDLGMSVWPLQLYLYDGEAGMTCLFSFGTNAFARTSVERLAACYIRMLGRLAADPAQTVGMLLRTAEEANDGPA